MVVTYLDTNACSLCTQQSHGMLYAIASIDANQGGLQSYTPPAYLNPVRQADFEVMCTLNRWWYGACLRLAIRL